MNRKLRAIDVVRIAEKYGWKRLQTTDPTLESFAKEIQGDAVRINVWHSTMTVSTCLSHPKQGKTQLFRRNVTPNLLHKIFECPRVHTDKGYKRKEDMPKETKTTVTLPGGGNPNIKIPPGATIDETKLSQPKSKELAACPFCGKTPKTKQWMASYAVECEDCKASVESASSMAKAIDKWSRRVVPFEEQEIPFGTPGETFGEKRSQDISILRGNLTMVCFSCGKINKQGVRLELEK